MTEVNKAASMPPPVVALAGWLVPGAGYWLIGQVFNGPMGLGAAWISDQLAASPRYHNIEAKARLAEIGTLYTAVAGMLNLLTIIDSAHRASGYGAKS